MNNQNFVAAMLAKARDQMHRDRVRMPAHILTTGQRALSDYVDDQYFIAQAHDSWLPEIKLPETSDAERIETAMLAAIEAAVNSQKVKLTRTHLDRFMKARHPRLVFNCAADAWIGGVSPTGAWGMSETDAWYEAQAEIELWQDGAAERPAWLDCLIADLLPCDHGDSVTVRVPGVDDISFTMHKHYKNWGTSPEDNRENWCRLCAAAGLDADDHDDVADALNSLFTYEELADPWADDDR